MSEEKMQNDLDPQVDPKASQNKPSQGVNPTDPPVLGPQPRKKIDYHTLKLYGLNDRDIHTMMHNDPSLKLGMASPDVSYQKAVETFQKAGQPAPTQEQFQQQRKAIEKQFANYQRDMWDVGLDTPIYDRTVNSIGAEAHSSQPYTDADMSWNAFDPDDERFFLDGSGERKRAQTDDYYRDNRIDYIPKVDDNLDRVLSNFKGEEDLSKNRNYVDIEIAGADGRTMRVGDFAKDKKNWDGFGASLRPGPEGNSVLVGGYDSKGLPIWVEKDIYDEAFNGSEVRSVYGPQKMYSTWYENLFDSMLINTFAKIPAASVGFVDWLGDLGDEKWLGGSGQTDDFIDEADRFWSNMSSLNQVKAPNDVAESGWAENERSFAWNAGGALGSIVQMILTRKYPHHSFPGYYHHGL